jgi:hypothetical protein
MLAHTRWSQLIGADGRIAGRKIPVVRRWGVREQGDIAAYLGVAFMDIPAKLEACHFALDGCDVRVFHVPQPRNKMLSTHSAPVFPATPSNEIVFRRRAYTDTLPASAHLWHDPRGDDLLPEHVRHLLDPDANAYMINRQENVWPSTKHVVVVDYEGSDYEGVEKVPDGTGWTVWPHTGCEWPYDRDDMIAHARHFYIPREDNLIEDKVSFLTMDEYREDAGEDYIYEEDDHRFDFELKSA